MKNKLLPNNANVKQKNPRTLSQYLFERAKFWWFFVLFFKFGSIFFGIIAILYSILPTWASLIVLSINLFSEFAQWRSDTVKSFAESLLGKLDFRDAFGTPISKEEISDILMKCPNKFSQNFSEAIRKDSYFASKKPIGPARAFEIVEESAWWSKHMTEKAARFCLWTIIFLITITFSFLLFTLFTVNSVDETAKYGRIATSALTIIFSLGLIKLMNGYNSFNKKAERSEKQAIELIDAKNYDPLKATKLMYEYQMARNSSPLLPTWLWNFYNKKFNRLWKNRRRK